MQIKEVQFALKHLNERTIFKTKHEKIIQLPERASIKKKNDGRRNTLRYQWMNEFSDIGSEISNRDTLKIAKTTSQYLEYKNLESF